MTTLTLNLEGPLQSWGSSSRFNVRTTESCPTKSGVIGLLAAAQGRSREQDISDLASLRFAVRIDTPGTVLRDFQTQKNWQTNRSLPLTSRYYLEDARFTAILEGPDGILEGLSAALKNPAFPLFLGRRSCPSSTPIMGELTSESLEERLQTAPWLRPATDKRIGKRVALAYTRDVKKGEPAEAMLRDNPESFSQAQRRYGMRPVVHGFVYLNTGDSEAQMDTSSPAIHDPLSLLGGI